jgi:light-regulated signal transduction histidine kinase (bacteriophytochrome)
MTSPALTERFMHLCSHELRGPVCTISGLVKLIEDHPQTIDIQDCLKKIDECTRHMEQVIHAVQEFIMVESALNNCVGTSTQD